MKEGSLISRRLTFWIFLVGALISFLILWRSGEIKEFFSYLFILPALFVILMFIHSLLIKKLKKNLREGEFVLTRNKRSINRKLIYSIHLIEILILGVIIYFIFWAWRYING